MVSEHGAAWSASSIGFCCEAVSGAYFPEEVLKVIKALKDEGSLRDEDPWVFLNTPRTDYVCSCPSLLPRLSTHSLASGSLLLSLEKQN